MEEYHPHRIHHDHHSSSGITSDSDLVAAIMMTAYFFDTFLPPSTDRQNFFVDLLFLVICCVGWKHLSEYGLLHKRIGLLHCISTDKTCSKGRKTPPLSSWAITDLTIIVAWCYLPGLHSVFADQQQQQSDPAIPLWWLCKCKCKMGLKKRFTR